MGDKKILLVMGSPRKGGNSATLAKQVAAGAETTGAEVESFYLHGMNIQPCTACDECREETSKDCVIDDDMQGLYPKLQRADALVIASPIYWFTVSAQTKVFMDRWYAFGGPQEEYAAFAEKRIGIVLTYADVDPFASGAVNALRTFQDAFSYVGNG
jgi:multimeric flavodoxin WrbA